MRLVILRDLNDISLYQSYVLHQDRNQTPKALIVSLTPKIGTHAKKRGLVTTDTTAFFSNQSHADILTQIHPWIDAIRSDPHWRKMDSYLKESFMLFFRTYCYCLGWNIEVLTNILDRHPISEVWIGRSAQNFKSDLYLKSTESIFTELTQKICRRYALPLRVGSHRKNLKDQFLTRFTKTQNLLKSILKYGLFIKSYFFFTKKKNLLFYTSPTYHLKSVIENWSSQLKNYTAQPLPGPILLEAPFIFLLKRLLSKPLQWDLEAVTHTLDHYLETICTTQCFQFKNIVFSDLLRQKTNNSLKGFLLSLRIWVRFLEKFIQRATPVALFSQGVRVDDVAISELALKYKIPSVMISHGTHTPPLDASSHIEWGEHGRSLVRAPFSWVVCQSPLTQQYLNHYDVPAKRLTTGPLIWGHPLQPHQYKNKKLLTHLFPKISDMTATRIILHANTPKPTYSLRPHIFETPDEYVESIRHIATAIEPLKHVYMIVKCRPFDELDIETLSLHLRMFPNVVLATTYPLNDLLGLSDLLISFSSTVIEEALQNRIPVVLYGGRGRYQHIQSHENGTKTASQNQAVYFIKDPVTLKLQLPTILEKSQEIHHQKDCFFPYVFSTQQRQSLTAVLEEKGYPT